MLFHENAARSLDPHSGHPGLRFEFLLMSLKVRGLGHKVPCK